MLKLDNLIYKQTKTMHYLTTYNSFILVSNCLVSNCEPSGAKPAMIAVKKKHTLGKTQQIYNKKNMLP
jgi:hypothetical protein